MKSMLIALDETPSTGAALEFSIALATRFAAKLTGISIVDVGYLTAPEPTPLGASHFKYHRDEARLKQAHEKAKQLRQKFVERCSAEAVSGSVVILEGNPVEEVRGAAIAHDAIVIGRDTDFHGEVGDGIAKTVGRILRGLPRPLFVIPVGARLPSRILIAFDGSNQSSHALQLFTLLGIAKGCELHLVCINPKKGEAEKTLRQAAPYLDLYDYRPMLHPVTSSADPAEVLDALVTGIEADLLVMGAYGHRGWRASLFGSCTTRLLAHSPIPLFIYQ